jgi:hypothetical protein
MAGRKFMALLPLVLLGALPTAASAAKTEVQPAEEHLNLILEHKLPGRLPDVLEGTHVLTLDVYPLRGIAVARSASNNDDIENNDSVAYVERIPKGPFDGHLNLHFKGLGSFVGEFVTRQTSAERGPKGCAGPRGSSQIGRLDGSIEFHGAGYRRWAAPHALAFLRRSPRLHCRPGAAERERRPKNLFGYVTGSLGSFSGWRYSLRARLRRPRRFTQLAVFRYERERPVVNFDAATFEWLPGGIAAGRFVNRSVPGGARLEASRGGYHPERATLRPPKPYSGVGIYSRATHRITGSLAVRFPGLKLRLGGSHTVANLVDEAGLPEKSSNESLSLDLRRTAEASPDRDAKEVQVYFRSPTNRRNVLELQLFPATGVAVADTYEGGGGDSGRGVAYAIAIPTAPFDGSLDLNFPGLGEFVGTVTPVSPRGPATQSKLCESNYPNEYATFEGHLAFRGAGGYGRWEATKAQAGILLACGAEPKEENGADALFGHVAELGPVLDGPAPIRFFAHGEVRHRLVEFIAWAGSTSNGAEFVAIDREWLPGEVATERWAKKAFVTLTRTVALGAGAGSPASATFTPPAPFFGKGTYRRRTGKLTGSLGVRFLGLTLHLTLRPLTAALEDEERR